MEFRITRTVYRATTVLAHAHIHCRPCGIRIPSLRLAHAHILEYTVGPAETPLVAPPKEPPPPRDAFAELMRGGAASASAKSAQPFFIDLPVRLLMMGARRKASRIWAKP